KRNIVSQACERTLLRSAKQIEERRYKIASPRKTAKKEIKHDQPTPIRWSAKVGVGGYRIHGRSSWPSTLAPRLRKLMTPIKPTRTAPKTENHEADARLRVGIFGSG